MILDDMMTLIAGSGLGLTAGTNLFAGTWPDSPDKACAVYETGGAQPVHAMGAGPGNGAKVAGTASYLRLDTIELIPVCSAACSECISSDGRAGRYHDQLDTISAYQRRQLSYSKRF